MKPYLSSGLRLIFVACVALLLLRTWNGPVSGLISNRSTLNIAAIAFLTFLATQWGIGLQSCRLASRPSPLTWLSQPCILAAILAAAASAPYLLTLNTPFLFDDFVNIRAAAAPEPIPALLTRLFLSHSTAADGFFRPLGILYFWLTFKWAGWNPAAWHLSGLAIHAANTLLFFFFLKRTTASLHTAFMAALIFAWHAAHVEAVCWTAASFDLIATLFCLLTLLLASTRSTPALVLTAAAAWLSKEAAFCLPVLVLSSALLTEGARKRRTFIHSIWVAAACAAVFIYRIWSLSGIGGYRTAAGHPMVFSLHPLAIAQALLLRLWALLFLPINWSTRPQVWLSVAITLMLGSLCFAIAAKGRQYAGLLFALAAAIPVFPLLLIGYDLSGARVLYLPSLGIAMIWCLLPAANKWPAVAAFTALFQLAALLHNELIWNHEARVASQACLDTAQILKRNPALTLDPAGLPRVRNGVFFLANGFPDCVARAGNDPALRSRIAPGNLSLTWDETHARVRVSSPEPYPQK